MRGIAVDITDLSLVNMDADAAAARAHVAGGGLDLGAQGDIVGTARRAEYYDAEQRVVLIGNARVWRDDNVVTGERITIYLAEDRSLVEGGQQERVKAVFYPRNQDEAAARPKPTPGQCS